MAISQTASIQLAAASATAIAASQTPGAAGALTLTASPVVLDTARRVLVTTAANETGKTLVISGTDRNGNAITETLALPNAGTAYTAQDFKTVTVATISAAAAGALTVGTNGIASTRWIVLNEHATAFNVAAAVNLGGVTANVSIEATLDDYNVYGSGYTPPYAFALQGFSSLTSDTLGAVTVPVRAVRLTVNSGAAAAGVRLTVLQTGIN